MKAPKELWAIMGGDGLPILNFHGSRDEAEAVISSPRKPVLIGVHPANQRAVRALASQVEWLHRTLTVSESGNTVLAASDASIAERVVAMKKILDQLEGYLERLEEPE